MLLFVIQVENIVGIELAYINTKHPDFADATLVNMSVESSERERRRGKNDTMLEPTEKGDKHLVKVCMKCFFCFQFLIQSVLGLYIPVL